MRSKFASALSWLVCPWLSLSTSIACDDPHDDLRQCRTNLGIVGDAIENYRKRNKRLPAKLSDLSQQDLGNRTRLFCPIAHRHGKTSIETTKDLFYKQNDPLTSYSYEFGETPLKIVKGKTMREWKELQMAKIGSRVPLIRCHEHGDTHLNLPFEGEVYESEIEWENKFGELIDLEHLGEEFLFKERAGVVVPEVEKPPAAPKVIVIRARDPALEKLLAASINLENAYNAKLSPPWDKGVPGNDLAELQIGVLEVEGVRFDVRGLIQLASEKHFGDQFPREKKRIKVDRRCRKLHFLHGVGYGENGAFDQPIAEFKIHIKGAPDVIQEIVYGRQVLNWWHSDADRFEMAADTKTGWLGSNAASNDIRLYMTTLDLGTEVMVEQLDFVATGDGPAPFLVAITAGD